MTAEFFDGKEGNRNRENVELRLDKKREQTYNKNINSNERSYYL